MDAKHICQSCGMPIDSSLVLGTNADGSVNEDYCKYCYEDGEFLDKITMNEYIELYGKYNSVTSVSNEIMRTRCLELFPTLKRWKM
ncbi:MAG: zinc ribbon domain-containing protein [Bacteroidales bacterium]|nr:zinc ribbon domain-containing protein [Bacteroidales bacterium]